MRFAFRKLLFIAPIAIASLAWAQPDNNGDWAVSIQTRQGDCVRAFNSSVKVRDGRIDQKNFLATVSGSVDPSGKVALQVMRGADMISASGTLAGQSGQGAWTAPSKNCAGIWTASRS